MSSLKLYGSTSGYVEIVPEATAGNNSVTLPNTVGSIAVKDASGNLEVGTGVTIAAPSSNTFTVSTNGSERIRVDSSGRALFGTSSNRTSGLLQIETAASDASRIHTLTNNSANTISAVWKFIKSRGASVGSSTSVQSGDDLGFITFAGTDGTNTVDGAYIGAQVDAAVTASGNEMPTRLVFSTTADSSSSPTERMRLTSVGEFRQFSSSGAGAAGFASGNAASSNPAILLSHSASGIGGGTDSFRVNFNGDVSNTNNSYGAISDIKLKENVVDANSQWDDLKSLRIVNYNLKPETNQETHTQIGLVAQEVELVSPGLVSESPDRDEDGNDLGTVTKSVNYSVLYMKAVKALQEAIERIETLEAKVAALEACSPTH